MASKLKMTEFLEENVMGRRAAPTRRMSVAQYQPSREEAMMHKEIHTQYIVDYRFRVGARCYVPCGASDAEWQEARRKIVRMFMREMFGDLVEEMKDFREWAFQADVGKDVEERITRLMQLAEGEDLEFIDAKREYHG